MRSMAISSTLTILSLACGGDDGEGAPGGASGPVCTVGSGETAKYSVALRDMESGEPPDQPVFFQQCDGFCNNIGYSADPSSPLLSLDVPCGFDGTFGITPNVGGDTEYWYRTMLYTQPVLRDTERPLAILRISGSRRIGEALGFEHMATRAIVTAIALDCDGRPAPGVEIELSREGTAVSSPGSSPELGATTSGDGYVVFFNVPDDEGEVTVQGTRGSESFGPMTMTLPEENSVADLVSSTCD